MFMVLYLSRRELYEKYLLRLTENTVLKVTEQVIKNYKTKQTAGKKYVIRFLILRTANFLFWATNWMSLPLHVKKLN
jgi:hypothetical protein